MCVCVFMYIYVPSRRLCFLSVGLIWSKRFHLNSKFIRLLLLCFDLIWALEEY